MMSQAAMQKTIGRILLFGVLVSACFVIVGGSLYLLQSGDEPIPRVLFENFAPETSMRNIFKFALSFKPLGIVELGLLLLVATQSVRVALLLWYYTKLRNYQFMFISGFILIVLIYSALWRT